MHEPIEGFTHIYLDKASQSTLLLLHGSGGDEQDLVSLGVELDPKANILSPRGKILENGMPRFFKRLSEGVFDVPDLNQRSKELADFIIKSSSIYGFDLKGLVVIGYSNGANIALRILTSDNILKKVVLIRPMLQALPDSITNLTGSRLLILSGLFDQLAGAEDADNLAKKLTSKHAEVQLSKIPTGHAITSQDIALMKEWIRARDAAPK